RPRVPEIARLLRAARRIVHWIEVKDDVAAPQRREQDMRAVVRDGLEVRRGHPHGQEFVHAGHAPLDAGPWATRKAEHGHQREARPGWKGCAHGADLAEAGLG